MSEIIDIGKKNEAHELVNSEFQKCRFSIDDYYICVILLREVRNSECLKFLNIP